MIATPPSPPSQESLCTYGRIAMAFQGGGALGAYHVGVFKALTARGYIPNVLSGVSIGGFLAAIIAGNPVDRRVECLDQFWQKVSWPSIGAGEAAVADGWGRSHHWFSAMQGIVFGQPNFFVPNLPVAVKEWGKGRGLYDTGQLRDTLLDLIDFDALNSPNAPRLILAATRIQDGRLVYFDSHQTPLCVEHVMASGALPPAFPPIDIDGDLYWDGGCVSNTPLDALFHDTHMDDTLCFVSDLYAPSGKIPETVEDVVRESKEIHLSSRTLHHLEQLKENHNNRRILHHLLQSVPPHRRQDPLYARLKSLTQPRRFDVVHVAYGNKPPHELVMADQEFSRLSLKVREQRGYQDMNRILDNRDWEQSHDDAHPCRIHSYRGGDLPKIGG